MENRIAKLEARISQLEKEVAELRKAAGLTQDQGKIAPLSGNQEALLKACEAAGAGQRKGENCQAAGYPRVGFQEI